MEKKEAAEHACIRVKAKTERKSKYSKGMKKSKSMEAIHIKRHKEMLLSRHIR